MGFEFVQRIGALWRVTRVTPVQHQALAACTYRGIEQTLQCLGVCNLGLHHCLHPRLGDVLHRGLQGRQPFVKDAPVARQVKHHVLHRAPCRVIGALVEDGGHGLGKLPAPHPQLAIQRNRGPTSREPGRCCDGIPATSAQLPAIPVAAHSVVLLAHPHTRQRVAAVVHLGQHQGGRSAVGCQRGWRCTP